jgi:flagellar basal-body rod protein FlgG
MLAQQQRHDTVTNNIANIQTPGFKADNVPLRTFPEMLLYRLDNAPFASPTQVGRLATGVFAEENMPVFTRGSVEETGIASDLALGAERPDPNGQVVSLFFRVRLPNGEERLTKNGRFTVDASGQLVTGSGALVLDSTGNPVQLASDDFLVAGNGDIIDFANDPARRTNIGILSIVAVPQADLLSNLVKEGNGLYRMANGNTGGLPEASVLFPDAHDVVRQGAYERSNVDPNQSIVDLMDAQRMYEANQRVIQMLDQVLAKTVTEVGRV